MAIAYTTILQQDSYRGATIWQRSGWDHHLPRRDRKPTPTPAKLAMAKGPDMEYDYDMLERETGPAVGHTHRIQPTFGVKYPRDRGD